MTTMLIAAAVSVATNLTTTLPTVVVEASRTGKAPMELAQHVETIGEVQIAASDAKNLPELAARIPGLNVYNLGAGNPALAQIQMRGYGENGFGRVLMAADGEYLNSFDMYAPNYARIPLGGVRRIEVLYEPTWWKLEGLSFAFTCDNLFDQRYCDYAVASVTSGENAWYPAAGRSFMFTVRYEF